MRLCTLHPEINLTEEFLDAIRIRRVKILAVMLNDFFIGEKMDYVWSYPLVNKMSSKLCKYFNNTNSVRKSKGFDKFGPKCIKELFEVYFLNEIEHEGTNINMRDSFENDIDFGDLVGLKIDPRINEYVKLRME